MKNIFFVLFIALSVMACEKEEVQTSTTEATILGRWVSVGFENNIRYEFTEDTKFTIYGIDGVFPTLEELQVSNPDLSGLDWEYEGDIVVVDLNFGNYSRLIPTFACDNEVLNWIDETGADHSTYYREGHDISACN